MAFVAVAALISSNKNIIRGANAASFLFILKRHQRSLSSLPGERSINQRISPPIFSSPRTVVPAAPCRTILVPPRVSASLLPSAITFREMSSSTGKEGDTAMMRSKKQELRKEVRARLNALTVDEIQTQSAQVWQRLVLLPEYQAATSVGIFLSMPQGEICTDPALRACVQDNKSIYVPQVGQNFEIADMELVQVIYDKPTMTTTSTTISGNNKDDDELEKSSSLQLFHHTWPRNKWGIPEPPADLLPLLQAAKPGDLDLLIVPGLAFDRNGNRLGQGKGYYDRFIERMKKTASSSSLFKPLPLVAVALDCQLVDSVPVQDYDQTMDRILLPSEEIIIAKS
jgi:5-formyltetrahydrofolate cyclo-ligase